MYDILLKELESLPTPGTDVANDIVEGLWKKEKSRQIAEHALSLANGESQDVLQLRQLTDELIDGSALEPRYEPVTDNLEELVASMGGQNKFRFNIGALQERVGGIGPGNFLIAFARPETGKTGFWVSLACGPGGWVHQGHTVAAFCNEEPATRTKSRAISAITGRPYQEWSLDIEGTKAQWEPYKDNIKIYDSVDMSLEMLNEYARERKPDIIVVDQLDKVHIYGQYARGDERLKALYVGAREIAKRHNCLLVGLSQASADAHGKGHISFDMMENSRTGKAAEGDLIIGIGKVENLENDESPHRTLAVSKNKLSGWHGSIHTKLNGSLSRYED